MVTNANVILLVLLLLYQPDDDKCCCSLLLLFDRYTRANNNNNRPARFPKRPGRGRAHYFFIRVFQPRSFDFYFVDHRRTVRPSTASPGVARISRSNTGRGSHGGWGGSKPITITNGGGDVRSRLKTTKPGPPFQSDVTFERPYLCEAVILPPRTRDIGV